MNRLTRYITADDNRFYGTFLLSMVLFFGIISVFWMIAIGGFVTSFMFLIFYHSIFKRKVGF